MACAGKVAASDKVVDELRGRIRGCADFVIRPGRMHCANGSRKNYFGFCSKRMSEKWSQKNENTPPPLSE